MKTNNNKLLAVGSLVLATFLVLGALVIGWLLPRADAADAQAKSDTTATTQISVRGSGSINAKPDTLKMNVGVTQVDENVKAAQTKMQSVVDAMITKIKAAGVSDSDYRTSIYMVEPVMDYGMDKGGNAQLQTPKLLGFRVTNILEITMRDPARAPELLDSLVSAGANTIQGVSYTFADQNALAQQAYNAAMQDAEARAIKLAGLGNLKLGRILSVTDPSTNYPAPVIAKEGLGGGGAIFPGTQGIQTDVIVTYEATAK